VVAFSYDALGRVSGRSVNGATQSVAFDSLGRPMTVSNALDAFTYAYADETPRVTGITSGHGPKVALTYFDAASHPEQNELLQQMTYTAPSGGQVLAQFGYGYDANSNVKTFTEARQWLALRRLDRDEPAPAAERARHRRKARRLGLDADAARFRRQQRDSDPRGGPSSFPRPPSLDLPPSTGGG
jgi:hypothetical protein